MNTITRHVNIGTSTGRQMRQGRIVGMASASTYLSLSFADALRSEAVAGSCWYVTWSPTGDRHGQADSPRQKQAGRPEATNETGKPKASGKGKSLAAAGRRISLSTGCNCGSARS